MSRVSSNYWATIMKAKTINKPNLDKVLMSIDKKLPQASVEQLNQPPSEFITTKKIRSAILASALNKSPGTDGPSN